MRTPIAVLIAAGALAAPAAAGAAEFEGTVVTVDPDRRSFKLRDAERGTKRIFVTRATRFERVDGLRGLAPGQRGIEVVVARRGGSWVASEVERSGGGGDHGSGNHRKDD